MPLSSYDENSKENNIFKLPWWVILLSVLAGLVLFGLIGFAMYRVRMNFLNICNFQTDGYFIQLVLHSSVENLVPL